MFCFSNTQNKDKAALISTTELKDNDDNLYKVANTGIDKQIILCIRHAK